MQATYLRSRNMHSTGTGACRQSTACLRDVLPRNTKTVELCSASQDHCAVAPSVTALSCSCWMQGASQLIVVSSCFHGRIPGRRQRHRDPLPLPHPSCSRAQVYVPSLLRGSLAEFYCRRNPLRLCPSYTLPESCLPPVPALCSRCTLVVRILFIVYCIHDAVDSSDATDPGCCFIELIISALIAQPRIIRWLLRTTRSPASKRELLTRMHPYGKVFNHT